MGRINQFQQGNSWRFSGENQPIRLLTQKQLLKRLERLMVVDKATLDNIAKNSAEPYIICQCALSILDGNPVYVSNLINSMKQCLDTTRKRNARKQN